MHVHLKLASLQARNQILESNHFSLLSQFLFLHLQLNFSVDVIIFSELTNILAQHFSLKSAMPPLCFSRRHASLFS